MSDSERTTDWRSRSDTIQRDPARVRPILDEIAEEIRRQDRGRDSAVQVPSLESVIYWAISDTLYPRAELIRCAALLIEHIALNDLQADGLL